MAAKLDQDVRDAIRYDRLVLTLAFCELTFFSSLSSPVRLERQACSRDKIADGIASITFHVPGYRRIGDEEAAITGTRLEKSAFDTSGTKGIDVYVKTAAEMLAAVLKDQRQRLQVQRDQEDKDGTAQSREPANCGQSKDITVMDITGECA